ncbi:MAG: 50S ribosomal protein L5 [Patescibacteria group bacterium]
MSRLFTKYQQEIVPKLQKILKLSSPMSVPRLTKIIISSGAGDAIENPKIIDNIKETFRQITGQNPVITKSKKAISGFKLRAGQPIGLKVTLRGQRMYEFFDRFVNASMSRIRDFHGISTTAFDKSGNLNIGIKEHTIFPEIKAEDVEAVHGLQINIVFNTNTQNDNLQLMKELGMPFEKKDN